MQKTLFDIKPKQTISYSMIHLFLQCPFRFKKSYIEKVNDSEYRQKRELGTIMHAVLRDFFSLRKEARTKEALNRIIDKKFTGKATELTIEARKKLLPLAKDSKTKNIISLESSFTFVYHDIIFTGKFDRIDKTKEGLKIIDYKSCFSPKSRDEVISKLQWLIYWIAAEKKFGHVVGNPSEFSFYNLDQNEEIIIVPNKKELESVKKALLNIAETIQAEEAFAPKKNSFCGDCLFKKNCSIY